MAGDDDPAGSGFSLGRVLSAVRSELLGLPTGEHRSFSVRPVPVLSCLAGHNRSTGDQPGHGNPLWIIAALLHRSFLAARDTGCQPQHGFLFPESLCRSEAAYVSKVIPLAME